MRTVFILILVVMVSCKSNYTISQHIKQNVTICPENGICSIELIPNKSIVFETDNIGIKYPVISEGDKTILKYTYKKNEIPNTQDGYYTEIVYAELPTAISPIELSNEALQDLKLYFGRLCYCKGETGYFAIKSGNFKLTKNDKNSFNIDFNFKVSEVPQVISKIQETISLKSN